MASAKGKRTAQAGQFSSNGMGDARPVGRAFGPTRSSAATAFSLSLPISRSEVIGLAQGRDVASAEDQVGRRWASGSTIASLAT